MLAVISNYDFWRWNLTEAIQCLETRKMSNREVMVASSGMSSYRSRCHTISGFQSTFIDVENVAFNEEIRLHVIHRGICFNGSSHPIVFWWIAAIVKKVIEWQVFLLVSLLNSFTYMYYNWYDSAETQHLSQSY